MLNLTQIHLATEKDKEYDLDKWARLFKATTWKEFKMISADNQSMQEAGKSLYTLSKENLIRFQCEARQENQRIWNTVKAQMEDYRAAIAEKDSVIAEKDSTIARLEAQIINLQQQADDTQK